jgi:hypothetical protein
MTSTSCTPRNGTSSSDSETRNSLAAFGFELNVTHEQNNDGMNKLDSANVEDDHTTFNDSNGGEVPESRSTRSGEWRIEEGDDTGTSSHDQLASKETRAVTKLKVLVFGSLCISMVGAVLAAYFLTSQAEIDSFELHFQDDANKLLGNIGQNLQRIMGASDAFIASITSHVAHTNQTWPYVVIPDFAVRAEKVRSLCGAVYVTTYHSVEDDQREAWENFTATVGAEMVDDAISSIAEYNVMDWPVTSNYTEWNVIYDNGEYDKPNKVSKKQALPIHRLSIKGLNHVFVMWQGEEGVTDDGPYLPQWQTQPTISAFESPYNWDLLSVPLIGRQKRRPAEVVIQEHKPVMTVPYLLGDSSNPEQYQADQDEALWVSSYVPHLEIEEVMRPMFDFQFPVLADAHEKIQWNDGTYSKDDHTVVAILSISSYWSSMISDILPQRSSGVMVVFESACTQSFTFEVNGPDVIYLGAGKNYNQKYDHMAIGSYVCELGFSSDHSTYSGLPLEESYCPLYVSVRPSGKMEDAYTSNTPWIFAAVTFFVFFLTVLTFVLYNYVVEQRQNIVLKSAGMC